MKMAIDVVLYRLNSYFNFIFFVLIFVLLFVKRKEKYNSFVE